ncbi:MAG: protein kinase [Acidobacteriota bacterium]|nr:protein kinase [Acidobacteriota bacterium]
MKCLKCHVENPDDSRFCGRCAAPLGPEDAAFSLTKTIATPSPVPAPDTLVTGKYKIVEELGRGGMGVVFKAEDLKLNRYVALKFLPLHLAGSSELKERFLIEAQAAAALSHPNICVIHEVGEDDGRPFIAMEYVEGETLRDRVKRGPLKPEEALPVITQITAGLAEAHAKGIIHRDIKSANIMVTTKGQAKVMDFGLAKLRGGSSLTRTQTTLGTVAYMSPEQARGDELDQRTDLWSLGVVLYEMLTGELPFKGDRDLSIIHSIVHEEPKPIAARKPPIPEELQQVVARALRKNRDSRYATAGDMLLDLRRYHEALQAEAAGLFNMRTLVKRLRRPAVAVPTVLAVVVIAAGAFLYFNHKDKVRWARQVAFPEIERMIADNDVWRNLVPPYRLAVQAESILGSDPKLAELFAKCSLNIDVKTEPPGAKAYMKEYATPEAEWTYVGETPIEKLRMPIGFFRWKFEKEGYETVLAAASTWKMPSLSVDKPGIPDSLMRTLDKEGSIPPAMVRIPGAELAIGKLEDFFIDKHEVTNRQFMEFVDKGGYRNREYWKYPVIKDGKEIALEEAMREFVDQTGLPGPSTWSAGDYPDGQGDHPVSGVSWYEAAAYAEYAGKSLPTSAHWGVALGAFTPMFQLYQLGGIAVIASFSHIGTGQDTVPVGSLQGFTPYGAYDMTGNVREWCWNETQAGRIIRGGAWGENTYEAVNIRHAPSMDRSAKNGFRCAFYPQPEAVPEAAFAFRRLGDTIDLRVRQPVPDPIFEIYKDQFFYDKTALDARVESRKENPGGWVHERVSFDAAYGGERVLAHLFLPVNALPPFQTVIYFPGSASTWENSSRDIETYYEFTMFLSFLVKNGRAVLYPVYKGTFERVFPESASLHLGGDSHAYTEFLIQVVKDFKRSIDYLETRPDIDSRKFAFYGMSWGGMLGAIIPAVEERLQAGVLCAGGLRGRAVRSEAQQINYVTRVRTPTLMLNGRYDTNFGLEESIRPMFEFLGTPLEHKRMILYDTDHIPPRNEYIKEILAWLDKYLGPVER